MTDTMLELFKKMVDEMGLDTGTLALWLHQEDTRATRNAIYKKMGGHRPVITNDIIKLSMMKLLSVHYNLWSVVFDEDGQIVQIEEKGEGKYAGLSDQQIMQAWVDEQSHPSPYHQLDVERFEYWLQRNSFTLDSLSRDQLGDFWEVLSNPPASWLSQSTRKDGEGWTPFRGPLAVATLEQSRNRIRRLLQFLVRNSRVDPSLILDHGSN